MKQYLARMRQEGISDAVFERSRRVLYADEIRAYDSTDEIANRLLTFVFDGTQMFSAPDALMQITRRELEEYLHTAFDEAYFAMSVIRPFAEEE